MTTGQPRLPLEGCGGCPLKDAPRVPPKLRPAEILAVGEAPGAEEVRVGTPFVGDSGRMLRHALAGLDVVYANTVLCRPENNRTPTKEEISACLPNLQHAIDVTKPRIILAIGGVALKALTGSTGILKNAGRVMAEFDPPVMPIIHPAWVLRGGDPRKFDECVKNLRAWLTPPVVTYTTVTGASLSSFPWKAGPLGFDIETDQLSPRNGNILSYALSDGEQCAFVLGEPDEDAADFFSQRRLVAHNATFETEWMRDRGIEAYITDDTQVLAHLEDERQSTKLESVAVRHEVPMLIFPEKSVADYPVQKLAERNCIHSQGTRQLYDILSSKIPKASRLLYRSVLVPATSTLADLHINGVKVDEERRLAALVEITRNSQALTDLLCGAAGRKDFNIKSAPQRYTLMYDILGLPKIYKTKSGSTWGTDASIIRFFQMRHKDDPYRGPVLDAMLELTTIQGWRTQFLEAFPSYVDIENILHGRYHVTGTLTGRLSTSAPNMQNMPRKGPVRSCLVSRFGSEGSILTADYKQIELVIFAAITRDERLLQVFREGLDVHRATASIVLHKPMEDIDDDERFLGKRLNFAMATGVGPAKLAFMLGVEEDEAREYRNRFFRGYVGLARYIERYRNYVPPQVKSPTGRVRHLDVSDNIRARNQALNFIPQEVALTTHLIAANAIAYTLRKRAARSRIISLIHDSCSLDVHKSEMEWVCDAFIEALHSPNEHPVLRSVVDAGVTFQFDLKNGPSMGEQKEITLLIS